MGKSIHDLKFELGFVADRISWSVKLLNGGQAQDDDAALTLILDTMNTSLEGTKCDHPKYMYQHQVGELELEKNVTTVIDDSDHASNTTLAESEATH